MDLERHNRTIALQCPTCGGTQFDSQSEELITCPGCGLKMTRQELRDGNREHISAQVDEVNERDSVGSN